MKRTHSTRAPILPITGALLVLLALPCVSVPTFAADEPALADSAEMSMPVATRLNEVIAVMDAGNPDVAAAAMMTLREELFDNMTEYEKLVTLQTSAILNTTLLKYPEAIADHEALLQLPLLTETQRLATTNLVAQLYLQLQDWNKGVEYLLSVNEMQGASDRETLFRIAFAYSQLGQAAAAIPYMEQALAVGGEQTPEDYYRNMATLYIQTQQPADAIATYEKLLEIFPDVADRERVLANVAALYIDLGNNAKAASLLRELIREFPTSSQMPTYRQSLNALTGG